MNLFYIDTKVTIRRPDQGEYLILQHLNRKNRCRNMQAVRYFYKIQRIIRSGKKGINCWKRNRYELRVKSEGEVKGKGEEWRVKGEGWRMNNHDNNDKLCYYVTLFSFTNLPISVYPGNIFYKIVPSGSELILISDLVPCIFAESIPTLFHKSNWTNNIVTIFDNSIVIFFRGWFG